MSQIFIYHNVLSLNLLYFFYLRFINIHAHITTLGGIRSKFKQIHCINHEGELEKHTVIVISTLLNPHPPTWGPYGPQRKTAVVKLCFLTLLGKS